jgi:hypothetical protein
VGEAGRVGGVKKKEAVAGEAKVNNDKSKNKNAGCK